MALFVDVLKNLSPGSIAGTISAVSTVWAMFDLPFPHGRGIKL